MKPIVIFILSIFFAFTAFGQDTLGFTNKKEARNLIVRGKKEGKWVEYLDSFQETVVNKEYSSYYRLTIYKKGRPSGIVRIYDNNGLLSSETPYRNGKINGVVKKYLDSTLWSKCLYVNGKKNGIDTGYWDNGKVESETSYVNDTLNGIVKNYDPDGNLSDEVTYTNDEIDGFWRFYYRNGTLREEEPYTEGYRNGMERDYYPSGKLKCEKNYVKDKRVSMKIFDENEKEMDTPGFCNDDYWNWSIFNCFDSAIVLKIDTLKLTNDMRQHKNVYPEICFSMDGDSFEFYSTRVDTIPDENGNLKVVKTDTPFMQGKWQYDSNSNILKLTLSDKPDTVQCYFVKNTDTKDVFLIKQSLNNEIKK